MKTVLVSSIKGGTGKSLISINIALRLAEKGYKVGLLDADIDSSYFTEFTKIKDRLDVDQEKIKPYEWNGVKVFSTSLLLGRERAVSVHGDSMRQLLVDARTRVEWGDLDVLVVDMPPGASDVFKTVLELYADTLVGGVIVTIPFARLAAERLIKLYLYDEVPILGLIENMAYVKCPECGKVMYVFGKPEGDSIAKEHNIPWLGAIPLDERVAKSIEEGNPKLPEDIIQPIDNAVSAIEKAEAGKFFEKFKYKLRDYIKSQVDRLMVTLILSINRDFDVKTIRESFGFKGGKPFLLIINDRRGQPITSVVLKVKDDKVVVVKKQVTPAWVIQMNIDTLAALVLGYKIVGGKKIPFNVEDAWSLGELKVYGEGSIPMMLYVAKTLFSSEVMEEVRKKYGSFLERIL